MVAQLKVALLLKACMTLQTPVGERSQKRYWGVVQGVAFAVKVIAVPTGCGDPELALTLSPLQEGPLSIEKVVCAEASVPEPPRAWTSTQMV